jgi:osmotically-inducible protein OsmY
MRAMILAVSSLIWVTACNKDNKDANRDNASAAAQAKEESKQTAQDAGKAADNAAGKAGDKASAAADKANGGAKGQEGTGVYAKQGTSTIIDSIRGETRQGEARKGTGAADKIGDESRQSARDAREGATKAGNKVAEETRQTTGDIKDALAGDRGRTAADKKLTARIRTALKKDKDVARDAGDVNIDTENGKVRLRGTVTSKEAKSQIARIASDIAGKAKVDDDVKVAERVGAGTQ